MQSFEYYSPTDIVFGKGAEDKTAERVVKYGGSRVFIVYGGGSVVRSGLLTKLESQIRAAGVEVKSMGGVTPNPVLSFAQALTKSAIDFQADMILGVGGGSAIDTAKAVALGAANPETDIAEYWVNGWPVESSLPIGAVVTLAATGSELSDSAVLTIDGTGKKGGAHSDVMRPDFAIMNPELLYTLPKYQIACGVADIIMHTLERYISHVDGNSLTDIVAEGLMRNTIEYGRKAVANRKDYQAMSEILWCGALSHNDLTGLGRGKDFSAHKLGHTLSAVYDISHGASLTIVWPAFARYVYEDNPGRFARFAEKVWDVQAGTDEEKARAGIRLTQEFFQEIGLPICFSDTSIGEQEESEIERLADICTSNDTVKLGVFHPLDKQAVMDIYGMVNH